MDVKALYPSIQWIPGSREVARGIREAKLKFENINKQELVQYVALNFSTNEINKSGLADVVPSKKHGTNIRLASREGDQSHLFDYSEARAPNNDEINLLMSMVVSKITHLTMSK